MLSLCADKNNNIQLDQVIFKPTLQQISDCLKSGGIVILEFHWEDVDRDESGEHFALISEQTNRGFHMINSDDVNTGRPLIDYVTGRQLLTYLQPYVYEPGKLNTLIL